MVLADIYAVHLFYASRSSVSVREYSYLVLIGVLIIRLSIVQAKSLLTSQLFGLGPKIIEIASSLLTVLS